MSPCRNCRAELIGEYCTACGERRLNRDRLKLRAFAGQAVEEIVDLEHSKIWRTIKLLFVRPGQLTREFIAGRRRSYIGPLKLYLTAFGLSLLVYSIYQPMAIYDVRTLARLQDETGQRNSIAAQIERDRLNDPSFVNELNSRWQRYMSFSQLLYPLLLAVLLKLLYLRRDWLFAEHLVFATHYLAFALFNTVVLWPLFALVGINMRPGYFVLAAISTTWVVSYLILAMRRVYNQSWAASILKAAIAYMFYFALTSVLTLGSLGVAIARSR